MLPEPLYCCIFVSCCVLNVEVAEVDGGVMTDSRAGQATVRALYLHIPFCLRKCAYCDFASWQTAREDPLMAAYGASLAAQVQALQHAGLLCETRTAYLGGGTPTLLPPHALAALATTVRSALPVRCELSCEANPESLSDEHLALLAEAGVTRLSLGVQSLDDDELRALGRIHSAARAEDRVLAALRAGFDVSLDLMCAIPRQSDSSWQDTLQRAVALGVGHVSVYPLQLEEGTALGDQYGEDEPSWHDPAVQAARMEAAATVLEQAGYARYEVASYARPGKACRHNEAYWTGVGYVGLGTQAASMLDRASYQHLRSLCPQLPPLPTDIARVRLVCLSTREELAASSGLERLRFDLEFLTEGQAVAEDLMLAMRMSAGTDGELVARARVALGSSAVDDAVALVTRRGLAQWQDGRLVPTHEGWLLGNELYGAFWGLATGEVTTARC